MSSSQVLLVSAVVACLIAFSQAATTESTSTTENYAVTTPIVPPALLALLNNLCNSGNVAVCALSKQVNALVSNLSCVTKLANIPGIDTSQLDSLTYQLGALNQLFAIANLAATLPPTVLNPLTNLLAQVNTVLYNAACKNGQIPVLGDLLGSSGTYTKTVCSALCGVPLLGPIIAGILSSVLPICPKDGCASTGVLSILG